MNHGSTVYDTEGWHCELRPSSSTVLVECREDAEIAGNAVKELKLSYHYGCIK